MILFFWMIMNLSTNPGPPQTCASTINQTCFPEYKWGLSKRTVALFPLIVLTCNLKWEMKIPPSLVNSQLASHLLKSTFCTPTSCSFPHYHPEATIAMLPVQ